MHDAVALADREELKALVFFSTYYKQVWKQSPACLVIADRVKEITIEDSPYQNSWMKNIHGKGQSSQHKNVDEGRQKIL